MHSSEVKDNILAHMKRQANIESDSELLEKLAKERKKLQEVLECLSNEDESDKESETKTLPQNEFFVKTSSFPSSFFAVDGDNVQDMVEDKLDVVEKQIVNLCESVQNRLNAQSNS
ncbi:predicted protein [Chaetoceros tenuissimus]|uniref:Uncharacterized protein n=1 Tax=Chaetoceros tenuissimus TaxID=426638 RepID=A0AAD3CYJ0_9STRA|nr:predicted protein [Chaetoceros tenuissimus]